MPKTILVCGYGPGISNAVARRFGAEGFAVALVGRNREKLETAARSFEEKGLAARGFPADLADPSAMPALVARVRDELGSVAVVHWNAPASGAGDVMLADPFELRTALDVSVTSLVATVQAALPDLKTQGDGAVLVTNGAVGLHDPKLDAMAVDEAFMGAAIAKTAQHKVVTLLARKLRQDGVYVGEVVVAGIVKGTAYDTGNAGFLTADEVAGNFWRLYRDRPEAFVSLLGVGLAGRGRP
ncbi:putative short chain dehydrogenase [Labilithrix luteola]|uniref:Putative short chain dehydrogenase n=1 Tax=Labilithrix luteola TaxID=1391654 RepID=A0A0K1PVG3_9BACT|nr:SDR family NAD(P)-dependent oxidoreductase [Labilithrix luteola]AKU97520.1 putative short chain dehydrogenase [Labilithrix luteola]